MVASNWKVGKTQSTAPAGHDTRDDVHSFSIQDQHGAPLLTISYRTKAESEQGEAAMKKLIENAIEISTPLR